MRHHRVIYAITRRISILRADTDTTAFKMSSMDVDVDIPTFLRETRNAAPDSLQGSILQMEDLWERRLWHQLTLELEQLFVDPQSTGSRMRMFKDFVGSFEKNINQQKLVGLALLAKQECKGRCPTLQLRKELTRMTDTNEALEFVTGIAEKVNTPATQDAYVYALVEMADIKLLLGNGETVCKDLDAANKILDTFDSIDNVIHAAFYRVNADYFSVHPPLT
jgi:26S proteasome regulatory subunit N9